MHDQQVRSMSTSIHLSAVKIFRTGADGGHLYIRGRGELPQHGEGDFYAYFRSKEEERTFENPFSGQQVIVEAGVVEFTRGIGGSVREIFLGGSHECAEPNDAANPVIQASVSAVTFHEQGPTMLGCTA
jgi:hypothetical protein